MTTKALETAPPLPNGCVDFNKLNDACKRGDEDATAKAVVIPPHETEKHQAALLKAVEAEAEQPGDGKAA